MTPNDLVPTSSPPRPFGTRCHETTSSLVPPSIGGRGRGRAHPPPEHKPQKLTSSRTSSHRPPEKDPQMATREQLVDSILRATWPDETHPTGVSALTARIVDQLIADGLVTIDPDPDGELARLDADPATVWGTGTGATTGYRHLPGRTTHWSRCGMAKMRWTTDDPKHAHRIRRLTACSKCLAASAKENAR